jgi:lipoate-protein ligase A
MTACRLILDTAASGDWNMAVDETLLESASVRGETTLRIYRWSQPTVSLGYFQPYEDRQQHRASCSCPLVRRASGGGALVHDRELTYSFAIPVPGPLALPARTLYHAFHETLAAAMLTRQVRAESLGAVKSESRKQPFLCFQRRTDGDLLVRGAKIVGSAQRRQHAALLQHGSVLLSTSPQAPELPGLKELAGVTLQGPELVQEWQQQLSRQLGLRFHITKLGEDELVRAEYFQSGKYGQANWTQRR